MNFNSDNQSQNDFSLIERKLFPKKVKTVISPEAINPETLSETEKECVLHADPMRQIEFAAGRNAAAKAMKHFGIENFPLLKSANRFPIWPDNLTGTISHSYGLVGSSVAKKSDYTSIGLDIESINRKVNAKDIAGYVCCPDEYEGLNKSGPKKFKQNLLAIFSAKEALFKCIYPITLKYFGFQFAAVSFNHKSGSLTAELRKDISDCYTKGLTLKGSSYIYEGYIFSGVWIKT